MGKYFMHTLSGLHSVAIFYFIFFSFRSCIEAAVSTKYHGLSGRPTVYVLFKNLFGAIFGRFLRSIELPGDRRRRARPLVRRQRRKRCLHSVLRRREQVPD